MVLGLIDKCGGRVLPLDIFDRLIILRLSDRCFIEIKREFNKRVYGW